MNIQQIILMIVLFFLGFINFEGIVQSLFYGPQKTYTIGLLYDSKKRQSKTNISLYQSFSMEFLHRSENKLQFLELLNFQEYKTNVQKLFMKALPITQIMLLPWRLNSSNIEFLIVNVDYILLNSKFKTVISMYQFDQTQEIGFVPYYSIDLEGKPSHIFKNNDSVHIQIISKDSHQLISVLPTLIFKQKSLISRHKLNSSIEVLCWDETINYLVYIQNDDPTVLYIVDSQQKLLTVKINSAILQGGLLFHPLKVSLIESENTTKILLMLLILKKQSISLRYIQFNKIMDSFKQYKSGILSNDIGVNPKEFQKIHHSFQPVHFYEPSMDIYIFSLRKLYFVNLRSHKDKHYNIDFPSIQISKIISFDSQFRLMLQYVSHQNPENSVLIIVLLNQDYTERLRQQIGVFDQCYDITLLEDGDRLFLIIATQHQYFDVYYLMQHDNPSIVKSTAKKLLATYALYKFSGLRIFQNYLNYF